MPPLAGVQSGHMGDIQSRSVPAKETKDTTCMLMSAEAFGEGSTGDEVCRSFGKGPGAIKRQQRAKIDWGRSKNSEVCHFMRERVL